MLKSVVQYDHICMVLLDRDSGGSDPIRILNVWRVGQPQFQFKELIVGLPILAAVAATDNRRLLPGIQ